VSATAQGLYGCGGSSQGITAAASSKRTVSVHVLVVMRVVMVLALMHGGCRLLSLLTSRYRN
jgi:hypothetical protein